MDISTKRWIRAGFAAVLGVASVALAVSENELPPERSQGVVRFMSGGIGTDQQDAIKQAAVSYPLELQFVENGSADGFGKGLYLAGIGVTIRDKSGRLVLETTTSGPYLLAKLPDGDYTVSADNEGRVSTRQVHVDQTRHQKLVFAWNA